MSQSEKSNPDPRTSVLEISRVEEFKVVDLLLVLTKQWKLTIGVPFVVAVITAIITLIMSNIYTAQTMIIPQNQDNGGIMGGMLAQLSGLAGLAGGTLGGPSTADIYVTMLKSQTIKDPLIDRFKLMQYYKRSYRVLVYKDMDDNTNISIGKKDGIITISVDDKNPKLAAAIANAYVEELGKLTVKLDMIDAGKNRAFLEGRLASAKVDLAKAEDALKSFQLKNKTLDVPDQAKATIEGVALLKGQLAAQEVQLAYFRSYLTESSREVSSLKASIAGTKNQIARLEGKGGASAIPSMGNVPSLGEEYLRLMRDFKIQEALVDALQKQYEMNKINEVKDVPSFQLLQVAKVPERKSKPKRTSIVLSAAIATGFVMVLLAFIRESVERMNDEERKRWQELKRLLPLPRRFGS
jgi:uncharacterized protein involved in exopolysaccharide biosynthesis